MNNIARVMGHILYNQLQKKHGMFYGRFYGRFYKRDLKIKIDSVNSLLKYI